MSGLISKLKRGSNGAITLRTYNSETQTVINRIIKNDGSAILVSDCIPEAGDIYVTVAIDHRMERLTSKTQCFIYKILSYDDMYAGIPVSEHLPYQDNIRDSYVPIQGMFLTDIIKLGKGHLPKITSIIKEAETISDTEDRIEVNDEDAEIRMLQQ